MPMTRTATRICLAVIKARIAGIAPRVHIQAVTTTEIKDVMNRYITGKKRVVVEYLPETMKPGFVPPPSEKKEKTP